jgi:hypothetical protein
MNKTKFTPGPWVLVVQDDSDIANTIFAVSQLKDGRIAAEDWDYNICSIGLDQKNVEANARLIAAAPDLYEALEDLSINDFGSNGWTNSMDRIAIRARAALAKARGEA